MNKKFTRMLALLLSLTMLLSLMVSCTKNNTPPTDKENGEMTKYDYVFKLKSEMDEKVILADYKDNDLTKVKRDTALKHEGEIFSVRWNASDYYSNGAFIGSPKITDWSEYDTISLWIYSHNACGATVQLRFSGPNVANTAMNPYFRFQVVVDWTGWKEIKVTISELLSNYQPRLSNLIYIHLDNRGWEMGDTPNPMCELNIGYIYLEKEVYSITPSVESVGNAAFKDAKDNWRRLLVGDKTTNSSNTSTMKTKISAVDKNCKSALTEFDATYNNGKKDSLFGQTIVQGNKGDESKIQTIYSRLLNMALGYGTYGSEYYKNSNVLEKIKQGLKYCYDYYYGPNVKSAGTYGNWWYWDIGIPLQLTKILLITEDVLGAELIKKYLEPFDYLNPVPTMTACNKTWVTYCVFASALLQEDAKRMLISQQKFIDVFDYVTSRDGFYEDGSFVQHEKHPYTGGYGLSLISTLTDIMYALNGTRFEIIPEIFPNVNNQYDWMLESYQPVVYEGKLFACVRGREASRSTGEQASGTTAIVSLIKMVQYAPEDIKQDLFDMLKRLLLTGSVNYATSSPLPMADFTDALKESAQKEQLALYELTHIFGNMDRAVTHNSKYSVAIAMNSTRISKYESINDENKTAWYMGDGMIYIYTDGYTYDYNYFKKADPYKMPGTTVSTQTRSASCLQYSTEILNGSAFVGGVSDGRYGLTVYDQVPAANQNFTYTLSAKKSYFIFDNEIVAIGSGISDQTYGATTVIENRTWKANDLLTYNGTTVSNITSNTVYSKTDMSSMHFTNMGGYVMLDQSSVNYRKYSNSGQDFFELWIDHGNTPTNAKYAYVYLPEATAEETAAYQAAPDVTVISQTDRIHAVRENKLGITGYAFYGAGSCNGVTVNRAMTLMVTENNGEVSVSVSDPTHLLTSATVTLQLSDLGTNITADNNISASVNGNTLTLNIDFTGNYGQTFNVTVK